MNNDNLVRMANRIGTFFAAMPDRPAAQADIVDHIRKFWEPRMRRALLEHIDSAPDHGLDAIVAEALRLHRAQLD